MSLLWADDFSTYGVGGQAYMLDGLYAELRVSGSNSTLTIVDDPDTNAAASSVAVKSVHDAAATAGYASGGTYVRKVFPAAKTTIGGSIRLYMPSLPSSALHAATIHFCDSDNVPNVTLKVTTTGAIEAYRGDASGTSLGASTVALTADAWHHIEWKILASQTVGTIDIYVNGTSVLALTGLDTVATSIASFSQMAFGGWDNAGSLGNFTSYWKDLVIWDTSGSVNNDVMGTCYLGRFTVSSDASFNWTASTGSAGYSLLDETGPNDADYISADATPPAASTFGLENLPAEVTSVRGIILLGRMKKSDGGDCNVQMSVVSNAVATNGSDRAITTAYTYWADVLETNTDTGVAFTPVEFNAATFKINRTL